MGWDKLILGVPRISLKLDISHGKALEFGILRSELKQRCMAHMADGFGDSGCRTRIGILIVLLGGDIQLNPGPNSVYNCGYCECPCEWGSDPAMGAICCDNCSVWFHKSCVSMSTQDYIRLGEVDDSWPCPRCRVSNIQSFTFMSYNLSTSNRFDLLSGLADDSVFESPSVTEGDRSIASLPSGGFAPGFTSSPTGRLATSSSSASGTLLPGKDGDNIRILECNVNSAKGKPAEIGAICAYVKPDILMFTETKITSDIKSAEFLPSSYLPAYRKDRTLDGGGVLIAARTGMVCDEVTFKGLHKDCELVCVRFATASNMPDLYALCYYRSQTDNKPNVSLDSLKSALEQIDEMSGRSKATVIVAGDFNCPKVDWDNMTVLQGNPIPGVCSKLFDVMAESSQTQMVQEDTMGDSTLDLFWTNNPGLVTSTTIVPGVSTANEHSAVVVDLKLRAQVTKKAPHKIHKWSSANWEKMRAETSSFSRAFVQRFGCRTDEESDPLPSVSRLGEMDNSNSSLEDESVLPSVSRLGEDEDLHHYAPDDPIFGDSSPPTASQLGGSEEGDVADMWAAIDTHIKRIMRFVPSKWSKSRLDQPWMTQAIKRLCRRCHRKFKKWKTMKHNGRPCKTAREAYFSAQKEKNKLIRQAKIKYINDILEDSLETKDSKALFRHLKTQRTDDTGVAPLKKDGQVYSDPQRKAHILAEQFQSVFTKDTDQDRNNAPEGPSIPPLPEIEISCAGVEKLLRDVNPKKAAGPDQVYCQILSNLSAELAPAFTLLYQRSYDHSIMPSVWSTAWITPVFKKGAKFEPANYRPVSLTCVPCKLMEHIIVSHVRGHIEQYKLVHPNQHGFTKKRHCESQLIVTTHDLLTRLDHKEIVDMAVLDFSKAFDTVPHQRLLNKLRLFGIEGKNRDWVECFLKGRTQSVVVEGVRSHGPGVTEGDPVVSGVPQGTVLGPLLFLLYINDLPDVLSPGTVCRLYADDCLIYRSIKSPADALVLQHDLNALHDWSRTWGLSFNVGKCNMMHLARQMEKPCRFYTLAGEVLKSTTEADYLGVRLSSRYGTRASQWGPHVDRVVARANQRLGFLKRSLRGSPYKMRELAFGALVRSTLDYGGAIWDPTNGNEIDKVERVQNRGAKWVRGARGIISITALLNDLEWDPMATRRRNQRLCLFYKLLNQAMDIDIKELNLKQLKFTNAKKNRSYHPDKLIRLNASDKNSPLWTGTVIRTINDWNSLPNSTLDTVSLSGPAGSITSFQSQLKAAKP